jgi:hypothetical protein
MPRIQLSVSPHDHEDLQRSGLTSVTIAENGLYTETNSTKIAALLNRGGCPDCCLVTGALVFRYRDLNGTVNGFARLKPRTPRVKDGKPVKYEQPKDSPMRAYFPVASLPMLRDAGSSVFITEGEKKSLALSQLGLAAIGIGGIWCGCQKDEQSGGHRLIDDLAAIEWENRDIYIVFDYDPQADTRRQVELAQRRLAACLQAAGSGSRFAGATERIAIPPRVYSVVLPPGPEGAKMGADDFIVARGAAAFMELVDRAIPVISIITCGPDANAVIKIIPPALDAAALHGPVGEFIRAVEPHTEATAAGILAHLLPAIGTLVGPGPYTFGGTKQPARINTVLVGPTSTGRKGTALYPVDCLMNRVSAVFWAEQRVGGLSTGEGLINKVADIRTWNDETESYDVTIVEKRLYVVEEEFSKVLAQLRRDGNILSQVLRESFDSGRLSVMTRANPIHAHGAHISITGHITPEELHDRFNHVEMANGFGNRFLWFAVKSDKMLPKCAEIPEAIYAGLEERLVDLANNTPPGHVPLASASMEVWENELYPALREDKPGFAGALLPRGSSIVLRLALLYCLLDPPPPGGASRVILPVHLDAAMAIWSYCEQSVQQLFGKRGRTVLERKLLELLSAGPMSKDTINNHLSPSQKAEVNTALANLEAAKLIRKRKQEQDGPGRPATVWERVQ